jgi:hypothetical protein
MEEILKQLLDCLDSGRPFVFVAQNEDGSFLFTGPCDGEWIKVAMQAVKEQVEADEVARPN